LSQAAELVFDEVEGLVGSPALGLPYSPASNVGEAEVEAEALKGSTAFVNSYEAEKLCVSEMWEPPLRE
jgi:hypothetical protein